MPRHARRWWLLAASVLFYASWNLWYVPGLLGLILANHMLANAISVRAGLARRRLLISAVVIDLAVLGLFKYLDWLLGSSSSVIRWATGRHVDLGGLGLILPLSISFVTFTVLAYVINVYRGRAPERRLSNVALFITFFPHLVAAPSCVPVSCCPKCVIRGLPNAVSRGGSATARRGPAQEGARRPAGACRGSGPCASRPAVVGCACRHARGVHLPALS